MPEPIIDQTNVNQDAFANALAGDIVTEDMLKASGDGQEDQKQQSDQKALQDEKDLKGVGEEKATEPVGEPPAVVLPEDLRAAAMPAAEAPGADRFRYKSHEEAEAGVRYFQIRATKAEQELAKIRAEKDMVDREKAEAARAEQIEAFEIQRRADALADIEKLDPNAGDYLSAVAKIQATAEREIRQFHAAGPPAVPAASGQGGPTTDLVVDTATDTQAEAVEAVIRATGEQGIDFKTDAVFRHFAGQAPDTMPLKDQIDWAVAKTRDHLVNQYCQQAGIEPDNPVLQGYLAKATPRDANGHIVPFNEQVVGAFRATVRFLAEQRGKIAAQITEPLGTGMAGSRTAQQQQNTPISLSDALEMGNRRFG